MTFHISKSNFNNNENIWEFIRLINLIKRKRVKICKSFFSKNKMKINKDTEKEKSVYIEIDNKSILMLIINLSILLIPLIL